MDVAASTLRVLINMGWKYNSTIPWLDIMRGVAHGLSQPHLYRIVHGDLKPSNGSPLQRRRSLTGKVLVNPEEDGRILTENVFISDLGVRHWRPKFNSETQQMMKIPGTEPYIAPEIFSKGESALDLPTDIWAVGCIGFEVFAGFHLFENEFAVESFAKTRNLPSKQYGIIQLMKEREPKIYSIIEGCLHPDPSRRFDIYKLQSEIGPNPQPL